MTTGAIVAAALWACVSISFLMLVIQILAVIWHRLRAINDLAEEPAWHPGISVLKPLCGLDDDLAGNLACFATLDYPRYEVLLGVRSKADAAWPVACAAAERWPHIFRVVVQRGEPGLNPKVNQLITLASAAQHPIFLVSDSNIRVERGYLAEIAALMCRPGVAMVTSPIAGVGEQRLGSRMDNLHLTGWVATGMIAASRVVGADIVVGKSMAVWRGDLARLGGFESARDVLGEDYVLGKRVGRELGKRVAIASTPVQNVSRDRGVRDFFSRYQRWSVMHRQAVGLVAYAGELLLNPIPLASVALLCAPSSHTLVAFAGTCALKITIEAAAGLLLRPRGFSLLTLLAVPLKDVVLFAAWAHGLLHDEVDWRGTRLRVLPGTLLEPVGATRRFARIARVGASVRAIARGRMAA